MAIYKVIHGTDKEFSSFDASFLGANTDDNATDDSFAQTAHLGFWFNAGGNLSQTYSKLIECEIEINNPLDAGCLEYLANWIESQEKTGEELREMLQKQGYDGIILNDEEFGGISYVVIDKSQITITK